MDDVWNDIDSLSSPATTHYQNSYPPPLRLPPVATTNFLPPSSTSPTTILTLTTANSDHEDQSKRQKPNPSLCNITSSQANSPTEYTEKFRRLMKNRESAARSRARKQARADELEHEVVRLAKENAKLKRLQKDLCASQVPKGSRLQRTKSAPF